MPYRRPPVPPTVALLTAGGEVIDEHGQRLELDTLDQSTRVWTSYDSAHRLVHDGVGEALCWNGEEIRWRHRRFEDGWERRHSDVAVIRAPFYDDSPERTLAALARWRDWLARYGASCTSTTGSAAWSLLRATIVKPLWTGLGDTPPLRSTLGGRQALGPAGQGQFRGRLEQWDMPAAYASELGHLRYGGRWFDTKDLPLQHGPAFWAAQGRPTFVRAIVSVPASLGYGPLPRRPRGRTQAGKVATMLLGAEYPTGRIQGVWTWQEIEAAIAHGCRLIKVLGCWVHLSGEQPFLPWWAAIQDGRSMPGLAGLLSKMVGNALWGQFCMDGASNGVRTVRSKNGTIRNRELPKRGGRPPAHDLAETVSGRIRARLYGAMMGVGDALLSAHTDGIWIHRAYATIGPSWRRDQQASRLDLLDPQVLRYFPRGGGSQTVVAGVPLSLAEEWFDEEWAASGLEAAS